MEIAIQFDAKLPLKITQKKRWVVASCSVLDVHSQGGTEEEARRNLQEALSVFFVSCFERGVLEAVLRDCGFKAGRSAGQQTPAIPHTEDYITVPIPFLVDEPRKGQCHA